VYMTWKSSDIEKISFTIILSFYNGCENN